MAKRAVLIVGPVEDLHSQAVAEMLRSRFDCNAVILDMSQYPRNGHFTVSVPSAGEITGTFSHPAEQFLEDVVSVWWRRPQKFEPADSVTEPRLRQFVVQECRTTFEGMLLARHCRFVNDRLAEYRANHKLYQLETARSVGFRIPRTLVSNDPKAVAEFADELRFAVVFKPQTDGKYHMGETRMLKREHLNNTEAISIAPVMFQEYIPCEHDFRVTVAGEKLFSIRIETNKGRSPIDWRLDRSTPMEVADLAPELEMRIRMLMNKLGLDFGAIDLRQMPSGEFVFFEVNPAGQFLFCDLGGQLEITEAVADLLVTGRRKVAPGDPG